MHDRRFLEEALARYKGFLYLIKINQEKGMKLFRVPTYDVDLMWHTHQLHPVSYCNDMLKFLGRVLEHDDTDDLDRSEGKKLDVGFSGTTEQFENTFGIRYWKAGAMYRGNLPSPVTSIPHIFGSEIDNGFGVGKAEKHLTILETAVIEPHTSGSAVGVENPDDTLNRIARGIFGGYVNASVSVDGNYSSLLDDDLALF